MAIQKQLLYKDLAKYYDYVYHRKNYKEETAFIEKIISEYKKTDGVSLLDIGCATGNHLKFLSKKYDCVGLDKNKYLLDVAKNKKIKAQFICADMVDFRIDQKFDVVICLFATISYLTNKQDQVLTINNISEHMSSGGIFIVDPWFSKEYYHVGGIYSTHYESLLNNIS